MAKQNIKDHYKLDIKDYSGKVVQTLVLRRVKRSNLKEFITAMEELITEYLYHNASAGTVVSDERAWNLVVQAASYIPVDGQKEPGLDVSLIEDDYDTLTELFFGVVSDEGLLAPILFELNKLDYPTAVGKGATISQHRKNQDSAKLHQSLNPSAETTMPTSNP